MQSTWPVSKFCVAGESSLAEPKLNFKNKTIFFQKKNGVEDVAATVLVWQPRSSPYGAMPPRLQAVVGPDSQFGPGRGPSDGAAGVTGDDQAGQPLGAAACARIEIGRHSDALKPF